MMTGVSLTDSRLVKWGSALAMLLVAFLIVACGGGQSQGGSESDEPIIVGMALAESGPIAPFDVEPGQAAQLRANEINEEGGVLGRQLELRFRNTQSDQALATNVATELIGEGAVAIVASCDFDYGSPAAIVAQNSNVPGISICASDPKFADTKTIGEYAFSMAPGSDVEASSNAEWAYNERGWRSTYVLQDESIEYTKALGRYFDARWEELGGTVVGRDSFPGGENVNIRAQATKIKNLPEQPDFIYLPSWNPGGAAAIRQIRSAGVDTPILGPSALDGALLTEVAGNVSDVYFNPYACYAYCTGQDEQGLQQFVDAFEREYDQPPSTAYNLAGYNLIFVLAAAIEKAGTTNGPELLQAMQSLEPMQTPAGEIQFFSDTCHKPINPPLSFVEVQDGEIAFTETHQPEKVPDIGDGNACAGQ